ncbi:uncharacterized protein BDZ99DRAFT_516265 [Mytilinidion resinicola]|uniref:HAD-like protein n=1 Tax=Mytilinidion resinicola TaxID=574789 RepID=A0A6A6Z366_9PEZI|nr:uncharacterized protein BDZ99DRAFT_516265 [Mytilinidion resinicola]KAF2815546.1 hypothetical protein BDZ99DRAFT_516265 [Mytilinidion resinicola]
MAYPRIVAFDLDGTLWHTWLDGTKFGCKGCVSNTLEDNLEIVENKIRDKKNKPVRVKVSDDIYNIISDLIGNRVRIAIASRNTHKSLSLYSSKSVCFQRMNVNPRCDRALWLLNVFDPRTHQWRPLSDYVVYNEIYNESKRIHFERIKEYSGVEYHNMLFFDDQAANSEVEMWQGLTFQKVSHSSLGLMLGEYLHGLEVWRRNQYMRCPMPNAGPDPLPNRRLIGYIGTDWYTGQRYSEGMRRLKSSRPSRWGWGMYVADNPEMAAFFVRWGRESDPDINIYICRLFVRDFEIFRQMDKVWVAEDGSIHRTDNHHSTDEQIAESQIRRDKLIARTFRVEKPYVLFSRHHWMREMQSFARASTFLRDYHEKFRDWNIQWNAETERDMRRHSWD